MNNFAGVLRNLRIENNYRQEDLAEFLGLSKQVISNYENALREPSFEILIKLSDFFMVSTDYLLGRTSFRNYSEAHDLEVCPDDSDDLKEFSIIIYRKLRACLEKTQFLYREKPSNMTVMVLASYFFAFMKSFIGILKPLKKHLIS